ncbi:hypothetical protein [Actinophytocola sp.]|uniref:hypothetical protein n=1 Tax=Actinophytocola sp. TaxID=1872138 RepID=UPI002ED4DC79
MSDTTALLADLRKLRTRARMDRQAHAFPLFLFGALILLAPVCYASYDPWTELELVPNDRGPFPQFTPGILLKYPELVGWYWALTIVGGLWLTGWWYRHRARRHGVETDTRMPTAATVAALLGFLVWGPLFSTLLEAGFDDFDGSYSTPAVNLPILFAAAALAVAAGLWSGRRTGWSRTAGVAVAAFFAAVAFGALGVYFSHGYAALVIIAAALLALAWVERSALLTVTGVLFTGVALLVNLYNVENVFYRLGWDSGSDQQVVAVQSLLPAGIVLVVGGVVAVVRQRR